MTPETVVVFVAVVGARFLVPLLIPRFPLPAIVAALVLDGVDQTIFQSFGYDPPGYQGYDKAMDVYYLAIAYLSTLRNWTSEPAVGVARFLYFYRLVGVVAFELTDWRPLLLIFPNTFEYFFIAYEIVRLRWNPTRYGMPVLDHHRGGHLDLRQAAAGVLDPHRPARRHRHARASTRGSGRCWSCWPSSRLAWRSGSWSGRGCPARTGRGASPADPLPARDRHGRRTRPVGRRPRPGAVRRHRSRRSCWSAS